jgi:hypothetical protein
MLDFLFGPRKRRVFTSRPFSLKVPTREDAMFTETKFEIKVEGTNLKPGELKEIIESMNINEKSTTLKNDDMTVKLIATDKGSLIELSRIPHELKVDGKVYKLVEV